MWKLSKFAKIQVPENMNLYVFWIHTNVAKKHVPEENLTVNNNDNYLGTKFIIIIKNTKNHNNLLVSNHYF